MRPGRIAPSGRRPQGRAFREEPRKTWARARRRLRSGRRRRRRRRRTAKSWNMLGSGPSTSPEARAASAMPLRDATTSTIEQSITAALAGPRGGENGAHDPERKAERAAPVAENRRRRDRRRASAGGKREHAAQRQMVRWCPRPLAKAAPVLPPAGHAAVDKPRIRLAQSAGPRPRRSITPGLLPSISASAVSTRPNACSTASGRLRSRATILFPRRSGSG